MAEIARETVLRSLLMVLDEAYEGPVDPRGTWFVNNALYSGVLGSLGDLSAADASRAPIPGARSIAAHAHHLRFSLDVSTRFLRGEAPAADWNESWAVETVDEPAWSELREGMESDYRALRAVVEARGEWDDLGLAGAVGAIAHAAYHLGAIRQLAFAARAAAASDGAGAA
jgi:hypothetical protein